jgi:ABC-type lipoprotein export system ATPase subunit
MKRGEGKMKKYKTLEKLLSKIDRNKPVIILGKSGPTGKTTLFLKLNSIGCNVIEISETVNNLVNYLDDKDHYIEGENYYLIVLNERIR